MIEIFIGIVLENRGAYSSGRYESGSWYSGWHSDTVEFMQSGYWERVTDRIKDGIPKIKIGGERGWFDPAFR